MSNRGDGMSILKQAKTAGIIAILAVLAGCAGQVNESAQTSSKVESAEDRAAREARQAEFLAKQEAAKAANEAAKTAEQLRNSAMAADTLFFFDFDKSDLKQDALDDLDAHAKYLAADRSAKVRLEGHADERGTRAYNLALGERRANARRDIFPILASLGESWLYFSQINSIGVRETPSEMCPIFMED